MENENVFIDEFVKKSLAINPEKIQINGAKKTKILDELSVNSTTGYFSGLKFKLLGTLGVLLLISSVFLFVNYKPETENNVVPEKKVSAEKIIQNNKFETEKTVPLTDSSALKNTPKEKIKNNTKTKAETVTIRVKVPVHKKIIKRKKVFVKDTLIN